MKKIFLVEFVKSEKGSKTNRGRELILAEDEKLAIKKVMDLNSRKLANSSTYEAINLSEMFAAKNLVVRKKEESEPAPEVPEEEKEKTPKDGTKEENPVKTGLDM